MNEHIAYRQIRSSDVRRQCATRGTREPCFICGKHRTITEAHHTVPLKDIALLLEGWESLPEPPIVWLCPNCHTYVHRFHAGNSPIYVEADMLKKIFEIQQIVYDFLNQHIKVMLPSIERSGGK